MKIGLPTAVESALKETPRLWLVTGAAGFIGSHLVEQLLQLNQHVIGIDNLSTGKRENLEAVRERLSNADWQRFTFSEGDIRDKTFLDSLFVGGPYVLHQAALGSVPRSIREPFVTHDNNVNGFLNVLAAARDAGVKGLVYASSSSVYGDAHYAPKVEDKTGRPLSPYAASKMSDELYAHSFGVVYSFPSVGLRYFNVFGPRQDPDGPYAAVIPRWHQILKQGGVPTIFGDGETSRDFCYVANVVQANILAALYAERTNHHSVFNIACSATTTLRELFSALVEALVEAKVLRMGDVQEANYEAFRAGDVRHSFADIQRAEQELGYRPCYSLRDGLRELVSFP